MQRLTSKQLLHILRRTLNHVDSRLMGHGERVAIIMCQILKQMPSVGQRKFGELCLVGLLHDIGAYKTEEIDDLMHFESSGVWEHSAYGYLFLKKMSPLGEEALPLLYHHLTYADYEKMSPPLAEDDFSGLIYLADRLDMVVKLQGVDFCKEWVLKNKGTLFSPYWVDRFIEEEAHCAFLEQIAAASYEELLEDMMDRIAFDADEIGRFLSIIAYAIDFRSEFMVLHTVTTVSVSRVLSSELGLPVEEREAVYYGALLHDVGKVACPVEILEKPGRLTPEEMNIMRRHVTLTREILEGMIDPAVLEIAARHHEKMDGSGYPQGLVGSELSSAERIVAVADVVSALVRQRSYKLAYDKQTTIAILTKMRDEGQFCPVAVNAVLAHYDRVISDAERYGAEVTADYQSIHKEYLELISKLSVLVR